MTPRALPPEPITQKNLHLLPYEGPESFNSEMEIRRFRTAFYCDLEVSAI